MSWNNIVLEGFCFEENKDGKYPCGQKYPTAFCLESSRCPHFAYSVSTERMAAEFVPLYLIIWDRFHPIIEDIQTWWWYNFKGGRKRSKEMMRQIRENTDKMSYEDKKVFRDWDKGLDQASKDFEVWIKEARKE